MSEPAFSVSLEYPDPSDRSWMHRDVVDTRNGEVFATVRWPSGADISKQDALERAAAAMDHMGDVLNGMDAVDEEEDGAHFAAFEKVRLALKLAGVKP